MTTFYLCLGVGIFIFQSLLAGWLGVQVDLVTLLVMHLSLHPPLVPAVVTAILLGLFVDCYSNSPLGLHALCMLLTVLVTKFCRGQFNLGTFMPQLLSALAVMVSTGLLSVGLIRLLEPVKITDPEVLRAFFFRSLVTSALAPPFFSLFRRWEKTWGRFFFRASPML